MFKYAAASTVIGWNGTDYILIADEAWHEDDPFVRARPEFFTDRPSNVRASMGFVEQATAAPGQKRNR